MQLQGYVHYGSNCYLITLLQVLRHLKSARLIINSFKKFVLGNTLLMYSNALICGGCHI